MEKKNALTRGLAIAGTSLIGLTILAPFLISALTFMRSGMFRFDYLMPAEFFPVALTGGGLLLWAALRAHSRRAIIGGALGTGIVLLVAGQALAVVTGLASGETEPVGWPWILVLVSIAAYSLSLVVIGVGGVLLLRDLFRLSAPETKPI